MALEGRRTLLFCNVGVEMADHSVNSTLDSHAAAATLWDVVVVGAGPAGAMAAYRLARRGRRVLVIEKSRFPRDKVCGGCLGAGAMAELRAAELGDVPQSLGAVPTSRLVWVTRSRRAAIPLADGCSLSRRRLDAGLAEAAIQQGAEMLCGASARLPHGDGELRELLVESPAGQILVQCRVVVWAAGLSRGAGVIVTDIGASSESVAGSSYLGAGVTLAAGEADLDLPDQTIQMLCSDGGYVGAVCVEDGRINLAAALAPSHVRANGGLGGAVAALWEAAGGGSAATFEHAAWKGTPLLTRRTSAVAGRRLFLVGDATGYVEPFTGEGMTWALADGAAVAELADLGVAAWSHELRQRWTDRHTRAVQRRQRACRWITRLLRSPRLTAAAVGVLSIWPQLAHPVVRRLAIDTHVPASKANGLAD